MPFASLGQAVKLRYTFGSRDSETHGFSVGGARFGSSIPGGYDTFTAHISEDERSTGGANYKAGQKMSVRIATGEPGAGTYVYDGFLTRAGRAAQDRSVELTGFGAQIIPRRTKLARLYRYDGYDVWGGRNDEDYNINANHQGLGATVDGRILYEVNPRAYGSGNSAGVACVMQEAQITRITAVNGKSANYPKWGIRCRSFTAPLANGDESQMVPIGAIRTLGSGGVAQGSRWTFDFSPAAQKNAANLDIVCTPAGGVTIVEGAAPANDGDFKTGINTVRIYGNGTTNDSLSADDVFTDLCTNIYDFDTSLIQSTSTGVLPLFWQRSSPHSDLLDELCVLDQMEWRVRERAGSGKFKMELFSWASAASTNWYIAYNDPSLGEVDIRDSDDVVNRVKVYYDTSSGRHKHVTVSADGLSGRPVDYYAGTSWATSASPVVMDYDVDDRQADNTYPLNVANALIKQHGVQIPEGTVSLVTVRQTSATGTEVAACRILAGDRLNIVGGPQAGSYRIYEAQHDVEGVTRLTIGRRPGTFQALVAKHLKRLERKGKT